MKLKRTGLLARFYEWSYGEDVPDNLCPYFWKIIAAVALFPLSWATWWVPEKPPFVVRVIMGAVLQLAGLFLMAALIGPFFGDWKWTIGLVVITVVVALVAAIHLIADRQTRPEFVDEFTEMYTAKKQSFTEKYCPRIDWI